jgi:PDZ domain-containing secreted protein
MALSALSPSPGLPSAGHRLGVTFIELLIVWAAVAGLKSDDLVVTIDGQIVRDAGEFRRIVATLAVGQEVVVEVKRKNELLTVKLTPVAEK